MKLVSSPTKRSMVVIRLASASRAAAQRDVQDALGDGKFVHGAEYSRDGRFSQGCPVMWRVVEGVGPVIE